MRIEEDKIILKKTKSKTGDDKSDKIYSLINAVVVDRSKPNDPVILIASSTYKINIKRNGDKFGDVYVQFKGKNGGPGDIYVYYDVPVRTYRRWVSAPSKGHYFWQYIRNNFKYSKLTGNKRGKLENAIN